MWEGINPKHAKLTYFWCAPSQGEPGTFCESHIEGETLDPLSSLRKVEGVKAASYAHVLDGDLLPLCPLGFVSLRTPPSPLWAPLAWARSSVLMRLPATSRGVRWLLLVQPLVIMVSPPRDFLHCFGSASAVSYRLQSCVATG